MLDLATLKDLRKKALAGADHTAYLPALLEVIQAGPSPESDMVMKLLENTVNGMNGKKPDKARVDFVLAASLSGARHKSVEVRKPAFYRLDELARRVSDSAAFGEWMGTPELFAVCRQGLADPGTDLDEHGMPVQPKGTLTLAGKAYGVLQRFGKQTRAHELFYGLLAALYRANAFMAASEIDPTYHRKLMDTLLGHLESLVQSEEPMPQAALTPEHFPNYITELYAMAASTEYRHVPLEPLMSIMRWIPRRKRYVWHLVEMVRPQDYPHLADMAWAHMAREMEGGHFAAELKHGLRTAVREGRLPKERVPEELRELLCREEATA
jgi:hypothetical protein